MTLTFKHDKAWLAAEAEVKNALKVLTDSAFKLFIHLCLAAPRQTGVLETSQSELARTLHKTNGTIRKYLQEMEEQGLCRLSGFLPVPYCRGRIEITDQFWPSRLSFSVSASVRREYRRLRELLVRTSPEADPAAQFLT